MQQQRSPCAVVLCLNIAEPHKDAVIAERSIFMTAFVFCRDQQSFFLGPFSFLCHIYGFIGLKLSPRDFLLRDDPPRTSFLLQPHCYGANWEEVTQSFAAFFLFINCLLITSQKLTVYVQILDIQILNYAFNWGRCYLTTRGT